MIKKMMFEKYEDINIYYLYDYTTYRSGNVQNSIDKKIMDLKSYDIDAEWKKRRQVIAENFFFNHLKDKIIPSSGMICRVPRSHINVVENHIYNIAKKLAQKLDLEDGTDCIERIKDIKPSHDGGSRAFGRQSKSLIINNIRRIKGKDILLLDDVVTTGNSLSEIIEMLEESGANSVTGVAIGRTI